MNKKIKEKLKNSKSQRCFKCNKYKSNSNPLVKCFECKKLFCCKHIHSGQKNKKMKINERVRDVCATCKAEYGYHVI